MIKLNYYLTEYNENEVETIIYGKYEQKEEIIQHIFSGKEEEVCFLPSLEEKKPHKLFMGLGKKEKLTQETIRNSYARAIRELIKYKIEIIVIEEIAITDITQQEYLQSLVEGIELGKYTFNKYKTEKEKEKKETIIYIQGLSDTKENRKVIQETKNLTDSINLARDMIAEPSNQLYPEEFAFSANEIAKESGFEIEIMEEAEIKKLGMEAFLSVGIGTLHKPRLIVMRYLNGGNKEVFGLVGKGLTCDTGGYCLKNSESLMYMKADMSGAASILAVLRTLAKNKCKTNVIGVVACCENIISGDSYKPGDILTSMSGKTIEVLNTDAEGRLTLADALTYIIEKEGVNKILDIATLTGLTGNIFGHLYTPLISNNEEFKNQFLTAAEKAQEYFWQMPNHKKYKKLIESNIADLKNTGSVGTITAALFLQEFVQQLPWIHLDIAATAVQENSFFAYIPNGPSGVAIRTIYELTK